MRRKTLAVYLVLGVLVALLLTACAGVAAGQNGAQLGGPTILGASFDSLALPDLHVAQAHPVTMRALTGMREIQMMQQLQQLQQLQSQFHDGGPGGCHNSAPATSDYSSSDD